MKNTLLTGLLMAAVHLAQPGSAAAQAPVEPGTASGAATGLRRERPWYRPKHLILQTAGGQGMIAAGAGYEFAKNRLEADVLLGYVPKKYAGSALTIGGLKVLYSPFKIAVAEKWQLLPVTVGAFFNHTHNTINDGAKGQYYKDYYWFSHDNRYGPILSSRITYLAPPIAATGQPRKISFYYELSTNDLYLLSYTTNTTGLSVGDILTLALGVKADF